MQLAGRPAASPGYQACRHPYPNQCPCLNRFQSPHQYLCQYPYPYPCHR